MELEFAYPPDFEKMAENFFNFYIYKNSKFSLLKYPKDLKPRIERTCRYCRKSMPEVSFKKKAHLIPEFLGNKYLICDYECDGCNNLFSVYEDSLANYLGIGRTLHNIKGKDGIPGFKSKDLHITQTEFLNHPKAFNIERGDSTSLTSFNKDLGVITFEYTKPSFRPIYIYKYLLKLGLSLLDETQMNQYSSAITFISNTALMPQYKSACRMFGYELNATYPHPIVILFEKKSDELLVPSHSLVLFFKSTMYQIFLWGNETDTIRLASAAVSIPFAPPLYLGADYELKIFNQINYDLSSYDLLKDEKEVVNFSIGKDELEKIKLFDPENHRFTDFPNEEIINRMIFVHLDSQHSQNN